MRDKIVIRGKGAYKTAKRPPIPKKKKVRDNRENSNRERSADFEETNNALVAISLESIVGSCCVLDILFFSHSSTNRLEGLEVTNLFDRNHHRKCHGK
jgi:hypothetical protein